MLLLDHLLDHLRPSEYRVILGLTQLDGMLLKNISTKMRYCGFYSKDLSQKVLAHDFKLSSCSLRWSSSSQSFVEALSKGLAANKGIGELR